MRLSPRSALVLLAFLAGCAGPRPEPPEAPAPVSFPGFDTWRYPGDTAMATWLGASPYRWVGYYLASPCHRDASWMGRRATLERMGWGFAVLYVGQQVWEGQPPPEAGAPNVVCSRTLLTEAQGARDAADAIAKAEAEGFPRGTTLFLDVERTSQIPPALVTYVRTWTAAVLSDGRYVPGAYVHRLNADGLFAALVGAYRQAGRADTPPLWVAGGSGFTLTRGPAEVGLPYARIWQGVLDVERTWGGVTLPIDENVASTRSPSAAPTPAPPPASPAEPLPGGQPGGW